MIRGALLAVVLAGCSEPPEATRAFEFQAPSLDAVALPVEEAPPPWGLLSASWRVRFTFDGLDPDASGAWRAVAATGEVVEVREAWVTMGGMALLPCENLRHDPSFDPSGIPESTVFPLGWEPVELGSVSFGGAFYCSAEAYVFRSDPFTAGLPDNEAVTWTSMYLAGVLEDGTPFEWLSHEPYERQFAEDELRGWGAGDHADIELVLRTAAAVEAVSLPADSRTAANAALAGLMAEAEMHAVLSE
ncbi:MAG: hypothetical protein EP330_17015 [Deltaproteobacteria bacterium]|nr:MAG: hypothetical protein EP330_17015 [Deltaproteobacteria bacterium]